MINTIKKFLHIALKNETWPCEISAFSADHAFQHQNSSVNTFIDSTGKRGGDKGFIKNRSQYSKNCVMHDAISNRGLMDMPNFWIADIKTSISLMLVLLCYQIAMQLENILLKLEFKRLHILFVTLINPKLVPRRKEIF